MSHRLLAHSAAAAAAASSSVDQTHNHNQCSPSITLRGDAFKQVETARVGLNNAATGQHSLLWHVAQVRKQGSLGPAVLLSSCSSQPLAAHQECISAWCRRASCSPSVSPDTMHSQCISGQCIGGGGAGGVQSQHCVCATQLAPQWIHASGCCCYLLLSSPELTARLSAAAAWCMCTCIQYKIDEDGANIGVLFDNRVRPHQYSKPGAGVAGGTSIGAL